MQAPREPEPYDVDEEGLLDADELRAYLAILRRHLPLIVVIAAACVAVATLRTLRLPSVYAASARIKLAKEALDPLEQQFRWQTETIQSEYINTQVNVLQSTSLAQAMLEENPAIANELRADALTEPEAEPLALGWLAALFKGGLAVSPVRDTYLVDVTYEHTEQDRCPRYANALARAYIQQLRSQWGEKTQTAEGKLAAQLEGLSRKLDASEQALRSFLEEIQVADFEEAERLLFTRIESNNAALAGVQRERNRLDAELEAVQRVLDQGRPIESAPAIADDALVRQLRQQLAQVELSVIELGERYGPNWPEVKAVRAKRDQLKLLLRQEIETIRAQLQARRNARIAEEHGLLERARQLDDENRELARRARMYDALRSEVDSNRRLYQDNVNLLKEIGVRGGATPTNVRIVDEAREAVQVRPNHTRNVLLGALVGLALGVVAALVVERLADRIRSTQEASRILGLPVLGVIPEVGQVEGSELDRYALTHPHSVFAEAFRKARLQLDAVGAFPREGGRGVLLCSSGLPREGKTVCALNVAVACAQAGKRTLVIDGDMRNPRLHQALDVPLTPGLAQCLEGSADCADGLRPTPVPNLTVLCAGTTEVNPAELLARDRVFEDLLAKLRERFDRIIIDTPPVAAVSDGTEMATHADASLLVVSARASSRSASQLAQTELARVGSAPQGVLFNHQGAGDLGAYYGYYRSYYRTELHEDEGGLG